MSDTVRADSRTRKRAFVTPESAARVIEVYAGLPVVSTASIGGIPLVVGQGVSAAGGMWYLRP